MDKHIETADGYLVYPLTAAAANDLQHIKYLGYDVYAYAPAGYQKLNQVTGAQYMLMQSGSPLKGNRCIVCILENFVKIKV